MTFVKITEQPSSHGDLDKMSVRELLEGINDEDARVAPAVRRTIPQLEKLVTAVVERMRRGGAQRDGRDRCCDQAGGRCLEKFFSVHIGFGWVVIGCRNTMDASGLP